MNYLHKLLDFNSVEEGEKNLKEAYGIRNEMGGALYFGILSEDCAEISQKLEALKQQSKNKMTREQAAEHLSQGYKLRHNYFSEEEFIELKRDKIITEDGYDFTEQFWKLNHFETGWELIPFQEMI